ncbi:MAG: hypothetical protein JSR38_12740 [Proteobacteria bacterium]|nr:hypothetical protein [Pseudomonadota bacterium]
MRRLISSPPGIASSSIGTQRWQGEYERLADAAGVVALIASAASDAAQARALCDLLHAGGFSTLCVEAAVPTSAPGGLDTLAPRLVEALEWLRDSGAGAAVGLFGRGLAGSAALRAAALRPALVAALVAQDASPDALLEDLPRVRAATLLVVGDDDAALLLAQRRALPLLGGARRLEIVPGSGPGRADPVATQAVGHLATQWFAQQLPLRHLH